MQFFCDALVSGITVNTVSNRYSFSGDAGPRISRTRMQARTYMCDNLATKRPGAHGGKFAREF
jgi:hypothetical protein